MSSSWLSFPEPSYRPDTLLSTDRIDAITRCRDALTPTVWASAGPSKPFAIAEDKIALLAARGLQDESTSLIPRDRFHDVHEMIFDVAFWNPEQLGELVGREFGIG